MLKPVTVGPVDGLLIWTFFAALVAPVTPKTTLPKARLVGETASPAAAAGAAIAIAPSVSASATAKKIGLDEPVQPLRA